MRTVASGVGSQGGLGKGRLGSRAGTFRAVRKARLRELALEWLEPRTLLATIPVVSVSGQTVISPQGTNPNKDNTSSPSIVIDPYNSQKMVAVWVRDATGNSPDIINNGQTATYVEGAYSDNGGTSWTAMSANQFGGNGIIDFSQDQSSGPKYFAQITDPTVAFDGFNHFYVLDSVHAAGNGAGELLLERFDFNGGAPASLGGNGTPVYEWTQDPAYSPSLTVDSNVTSYTDTNSSGQTTTQGDPYADNLVNGVHYGTIYATWSQNNNVADVKSQDSPDAALSNGNPSVVKVSASNDGGALFGTDLYLNNNNGSQNYQSVNASPERDSTPQLAISQGTATTTGLSAITPGQVTAVWDDSGTHATATPAPYDNIVTNTIKQGGGGQTFAYSGPSGIAQGAVPQINTYTLPVSFTNPNAIINGLDVELNITHPTLSQVSILLTSPTGQQITLLNPQQRSSSATADTNVGMSGANLGGTVASPRILYTTFDALAPRSIHATTGGNASSGHFRPEGSRTDTATLASFDGLTAGSLNGNWVLTIIDYTGTTTPPTPPPQVNLFDLVFTTGMQLGTQRILPNLAIVPDTASTAFTTGIQGAAAGSAAPLTAGTPVPDTGIVPAPVIVSDNTLGAYSAHQGRIYVAYTGKYVGPGISNAATNSDIFLSYSDNGGLSWSTPEQVNNDNATTDGYTGSGTTGGQVTGTNTAFISGRPQFQPSMQVDPSTGTLVLSFLDARDDASGVRVATYLATSIDGGVTFGSQTFANIQETAIDAITGNTVVIGPLADNQSSGNAIRDTTFDFGSHQGLAVYDGKVYPIWASNINGGTDGKRTLHVTVATATIAAGPRIVASTMGPVSQSGDTLNPPTAGGTPEFSTIQVTFDRAIDPSTFTNGAVTVSFQDTNANDPPVNISVSSVTPVLSSAVDNPSGTLIGYTVFNIHVPTQTKVGTYSYAIAPVIKDRVRTASNVGGTTLSTGNLMDQNANGTGGENPGDIYAIPTPLNGTPFQAPYNQNTLPISIPGPHVISTSEAGRRRRPTTWCSTARSTRSTIRTTGPWWQAA